MSTRTHYNALCLAPTASPEVIRTAYKALALIYHPDKTLHIAPQERASHAAVFNRVQAAYDVLSNPTLKASYDAELARHGNTVDEKHSTFHHSSASQANPDTSSTPERKTTMKLATPEEKSAMRTKARHTFEYFREQRAKRDAEEAQIDTVSLKSMLQIWKDLAEENKTDPSLHATCAIRVHEYEQKIAERERQHEEWLAKMATAKTTPLTPSAKEQSLFTPGAPKKPVEPRTNSPSRTPNIPHPRMNRSYSGSTSPTLRAYNASHAKGRKRAEAERAAAQAQAQACILDKAQREAAEQTQIKQKAADVRADKEIQKARIAKSRSEAGVALLGSIGAAMGNASSCCDLQVGLQVSEAEYRACNTGTSVTNDGAADVSQPSVKSLCGRCGPKYLNFREWRKCSAQAAIHEGKDDDDFLS